MKPLNKIISRYLYRITFILIGIIIVFLTLIQLLTEQFRNVDDSHRTLQQIEQVLLENHKELEEIKETYTQTCLKNAETVSRIIERDPAVMNDLEGLKKIAEMVEIDEIHLFDKTGRIFAGTHPEYYNLTFDSGEQMLFFKPMLTDKSLKLVQAITPNTAEEKPMQYSAVWSEKGDVIVQIGMEPVNVLKVTEKNELSYIFSLFRVNPDMSYYSIDSETYEILGSTNTDDSGRNAAELGFDMNRIRTDPDGFHDIINGTLTFCVFTELDGNYIGCVISAQHLYRRVPTTVLWISLSLLTIALILIKGVTKHTDRYVVSELHEVNEKLLNISEGNLNTQVDVKSSKELAELSEYINMMVKSLLENSKRISYILSKTNLYIGTYEYGGKINGVQYTGYVPFLLNAESEEEKEALKNIDNFKSCIDIIRSNSISDEEKIYLADSRYIRIEESENEGVVFGVIVDVTDEMNKRKELERERDIDALTGLYNRRGINARLEELMANPDELGHSTLIMIDADGLKEINDTYGHEKGDIYLKKIANLINNFGIKSSVSARQDGDEYILFLYDYDSEEELSRTIETLRYIQSTSTASLGKGITVPLRFSMGCCVVENEYDIQKLFKIADERMYKDKVERKKQFAKTATE
ncbi:MAG: diguanylate cyclase [Oscillospiraceae bacterium]|nr:diguanylate cyclase [Oscillospiraceae bacterium]